MINTYIDSSTFLITLALGSVTVYLLSKRPELIEKQIN